MISVVWAHSDIAMLVEPSLLRKEDEEIFRML